VDVAGEGIEVSDVAAEAGAIGVEVEEDARVGGCATLQFIIAIFTFGRMCALGVASLAILS